VNASEAGVLLKETMLNPNMTSDSDRSMELAPAGRISVDEIARRLDIGRLAVYKMLQQGLLPGIRLGRRWIVTRNSYERWERTCGLRPGAGLPAEQEVTVN
jgi:excisionase family DNA binding protein